ncbi:MAG: hypothetical protein AAFZ92_06810 [Pseudomonadota bacterium]
MYLPGFTHHIVQRGNNRGGRFYDEENYQFYLELLKEVIPRVMGVQLQSKPAFNMVRNTQSVDKQKITMLKFALLQATATGKFVLSTRPLSDDI